MLVAVYFSFTSLSTVGLGDYHPKSNPERACTAMLLLIGVAVFSYILGNFIEILQQLQKFNEELDDGDELTKFF